MEIHKPSRVHNWRDLTREVGVIVLGVLIALAAEQAVQAIEWRHKTEAAEEAMRLELSKDDGPQVWARYAMNRCVDMALTAIRDGAERGAPRAEIIALIARHRTQFWTWDSLAFASANNSDVSLHLPSEKMHRWAMAYAAMPALDQANAKEFSDGADLVAISRTGGALSEAERRQILRSVEVLRRDNAKIWAGAQVALPAIYATGVKLDVEVMKLIRTILKRDYSPSCLVTPPSH